MSKEAVVGANHVSFPSFSSEKGGFIEYTKSTPQEWYISRSTPLEKWAHCGSERRLWGALTFWQRSSAVPACSLYGLFMTQTKNKSLPLNCWPPDEESWHRWFDWLSCQDLYDVGGSAIWHERVKTKNFRWGQFCSFFRNRRAFWAILVGRLGANPSIARLGTVVQKSATCAAADRSSYVGSILHRQRFVAWLY
jgi:hypothetical protein